MEGIYRQFILFGDTNMEKITGNNRKLIENCITFARKFLVLPKQIEIFFDDCPSDRFPNANNAAESEGNRLFFNKQWFLKSKAGHIDDIEFYVYHELRHIYQFQEIELLCSGEKTHEQSDIILKWKSEFEHYIRNEDVETERMNLIQEVEQDANGYGLALLNMEYIQNKDIVFHYSLPEYAHQMADERSKHYYRICPEFQQYIKQQRMLMQKKRKKS